MKVKHSLILFFTTFSFCSFSQNDGLTLKNLKSMLPINKWYSTNMDSSYFLKDTLWIENSPNYLSESYFVWNIYDKRKMVFFTFYPEEAISTPMKIGYKYQVFDRNEKIYIA